MDILLILSYGALAYAAFRFLGIPVNKWTVPTAVLGGVVLIGIILLFMNYNHPFTPMGRFYFASVPIVPEVEGQVIEVPVQANVPVKQGDVLFKIDPTPFQYVVDQRKAALAEAEQDVLQLKSALDSANAEVDEATAERDRAKAQYDRYVEANRIGGPDSAPFSEQQVENQRQLYLAKDADLESGEAKAEEARLAYESQIGGVNTTVAQLRAQLEDAERDLALTVMRAPSDGVVPIVPLRVGQRAVPLPLRPVMAFVPAGNVTFAAAFVQNAMQRVKAGYEAEIAFDAVPGRVFRGKVGSIVEGMVQGEIQAGGTLIDPAARPLPGRVVVEIEILDDLSSYQLPPGSSGQVAVYSEYAHAFKIIRQILLRMKSWQNFIFIEGH
ncbi:MAG: HlyD family secretion protein [Pseudomonadota bacterium]|nr:HlyD family secretion protein [Pseudomonadota bacterium]